MSDDTPCQEYGHLYEPCYGTASCESGNCKYMICGDCGDEYEED